MRLREEGEKKVLVEAPVGIIKFWNYVFDSAVEKV